MKKYLVSLAAGVIVTTQIAFAELNIDDYSAQTILAQNEPQEEEEQKPFAIHAAFNGAGKADFEHKHCKGRSKDVQFAIGVVDASMIFYYNPCYKEGALFTTSYTYTHIKWRNPFIKQDNFNTVSFALAGFSERVCQWSWNAQVQVNADINHFKFADYFTFNIILEGRYAYNDYLGLHAGFIALTGMRIDHLYPIFGIDWQIASDWKLNLVFPLNMSLVYSINPEWTVEIASRTFEERHRAGPHERYARGLIQYTSSGVEGGVSYLSCNESLYVNLHAGEMLGGKIKVANKRNRDSHRYRFKASPYVGGEITYRF